MKIPQLLSDLRNFFGSTRSFANASKGFEVLIIYFEIELAPDTYEKGLFVKQRKIIKNSIHDDK
jgi:hypothetical protein